MLCRDSGERLPWPTWPKPDFTHLSRKVKEVIRAAGLRNELSFTSLRHSGFTETGDAGLTDREILRGIDAPPHLTAAPCELVVLALPPANADIDETSRTQVQARS
jgi:hypothetical protein